MTTIVLVRKDNNVVVASDGQVSMGNTIINDREFHQFFFYKEPFVEGTVFLFFGSNSSAALSDLASPL